MKIMLCFLLVLLFSGGYSRAGEIVNVVNFKVVGDFDDEIDLDPHFDKYLNGYRRVKIESDDAVRMANSIADEVIKLQAVKGNPDSERFRKILFSLSEYCMQISLYVSEDGRNKRAVINSFYRKVGGEELNVSGIVRQSGFGIAYWRAYFDLSENTIKFVINEVY